MSKLKLSKDERDAQAVRDSFEFFYNNKFFNKWMRKFKITGLDYQESYYVLKKLWADGTIACSRRIGIPEEVKNMISPIVFTPWVMGGVYNCYDFPTHAQPINTHSVSFINVQDLEIDKDIVIGWCQPSHKGVSTLIEPKLKELVDTEMVIRVCTKNQKAPWIVAMSPEDKKAVDKLINDLKSDEPVLVTMLSDLKNSKALTSGAPYVVDKLETHRQKIEDDIDTLMGESNVGIAQKKEHFTDDEVQANNNQIKESGENFLDEIKEFFDRCNTCFGRSITIELAHDQEITYNDYDESQEEDDNE